MALSATRYRSQSYAKLCLVSRPVTFYDPALLRRVKRYWRCPSRGPVVLGSCLSLPIGSMLLTPERPPLTSGRPCRLRSAIRWSTTCLQNCLGPLCRKGIVIAFPRRRPLRHCASSFGVSVVGYICLPSSRTARPAC